jgi:glycosyltransferase involved in cell wall biosynthesis
MVPSGALPARTLLCLSHLRWNFVFQRPQHLLTRAAKEYRVLFVEEPVFDDRAEPGHDRTETDGVTVIVPRLPHGCDAVAAQRALLEELTGGEPVDVLWFYTPMALEFADDVQARVTVYDNMDELALFHGADSRIVQLENELFERADVVFTGGVSLWEAKQDRHPNIHAVPSSVDTAHFGRARNAATPDPQDQAHIPHPRIGFFGVVDERMDMAMLEAAAKLRPDWQFVVIGPVVKIDPASRPERPNIHWLGGKSYNELPEYLAHWDCGFMPFAINDATKFISPTKTPEFLAAGVPVVSTRIRDVERPYGEQALVHIADNGDAAVRAMASALKERTPAWRLRVDRFLGSKSWDATWSFMSETIAAATAEPAPKEMLHA